MAPVTDGGQLVAGEMGRAVVVSWRALSHHARGCSDCTAVVERLAQVPDVPWPLRDRCCAFGAALFDCWGEAKLEMVEHLKTRAAPWGLAGLPEPEAQERAAAIATLSGSAARELFATPDDELRQSKIEAVVRAYRLGGSAMAREPDGAGSPPAGRRPCEWEGCRSGPYGSRGSFRPSPHAPNKRFCCPACGEAARAGRRLKVLSAPGAYDPGDGEPEDQQ